MAQFKFIENEWNTNRTYNQNYKGIPKKSGVYLIVNTTINNNKINNEILYVGSSKNLEVRFSKHEVYRVLNEIYENVRFYFKETSNYLETEKQLIKQIQPRFNKQWL